MSEWDKYGKCPCGYMERAPFGDLFHIHREVCPRCGVDKDEWLLITARRVPQGWFKPYAWEIKP